MKKEMLINVKQPEECRIAIVEDGVLEELYVERTSHESYTGNIYKGRIVNLEPAIQAAFVDFSVGRNGFLHVSDVESQYFDRVPHARHAGEPELGPRVNAIAAASRAEKATATGAATRDGARQAPEPLDTTFGPTTGRTAASRRPLPGKASRSRSEIAIETAIARANGNAPISPIRGRRDRSEPPPRRFGEGLVSQPEPWPEPEPPVEPVSFLEEPPIEQKTPEPVREPAEPRTASWPEAQGDWAPDRFEEAPSPEAARQLGPPRRSRRRSRSAASCRKRN